MVRPSRAKMVQRWGINSSREQGTSIMHRISTQTAALLGLVIGCWALSHFTVAAHAQSPASTPRVLPHAHAHNDYLHDRPLLDALDHGFNSVEADIFLVDGQLL